MAFHSQPLLLCSQQIPPVVEWGLLSPWAQLLCFSWECRKLTTRIQLCRVEGCTIRMLSFISSRIQPAPSPTLPCMHSSWFDLRMDFTSQRTKYLAKIILWRPKQVAMWCLDIWINAIPLSKKSKHGKGVHRLSLEKVEVTAKWCFEALQWTVKQF